MRPRAAAGIAMAVTILATSAGAQPASRNVRASLISEVESIQPGKPFLVGLRLVMAPDWHTYWRNPGDSGLPTKLRFTLPEGVSAGPLQWPFPTRIAVGPLVSYGYEGDILLLTEVTPSPTLAPGSVVTLAGRADWLECKEACIPGRAQVQVSLPVRATTPVPSAPNVPLFARAKAQLPRPRPGFSPRAQAEKGAITLSWAATPPGAAASEATFFSDSPQIVAYGESQALSTTGREHHLRVSRDPNGTLPSRLTGVLVVGRGATAEAFALDAPLVPERMN